jgi:hypothetical protein
MPAIRWIKRFDREPQDVVGWRSGDRERVPAPSVASFQEQHGELPGYEAHRVLLAGIRA